MWRKQGKTTKKARERYQNLPKEEKEKKTTIWLGMLQNSLADKSLLSIEKNIKESEKNAFI